MPSTSSILVEYLRQQKIGFSFTAKSMYDLLHPDNPSVTVGGIGGWSSKNANGVTLEASRTGREQTYTLLDNKMTDIVVRTSTTNGGIAGRQSHHTVRPKTATVESVREKLLDLACQLETAQTPLSAFSTDELLAELTRRNRAAK